MKREHVRVESINVVCKAGDNLGGAVPDAIMLALTEKVDVILEYNDVQVKIRYQELLDRYYKEFHELLEDNSDTQKE